MLKHSFVTEYALMVTDTLEYDPFEAPFGGGHGYISNPSTSLVAGPPPSSFPHHMFHNSESDFLYDDNLYRPALHNSHSLLPHSEPPISPTMHELDREHELDEPATYGLDALQNWVVSGARLSAILPCST